MALGFASRLHNRFALSGDVWQQAFARTPETQVRFLILGEFQMSREKLVRSRRGPFPEAVKSVLLSPAHLKPMSDPKTVKRAALENLVKTGKISRSES